MSNSSFMIDLWYSDASLLYGQTLSSLIQVQCLIFLPDGSSAKSYGSLIVKPDKIAWSKAMRFQCIRIEWSQIGIFITFEKIGKIIIHEEMWNLSNFFSQKLHLGYSLNLRFRFNKEWDHCSACRNAPQPMNFNISTIIFL